MPRRKIREYAAKHLLQKHVRDLDVRFRSVQVSPSTDLLKLKDDHHWLAHERLVVKPDMLFGKRGKNNLVLLDGTLASAISFIQERMHQTVAIGSTVGEVTHFIIEPYVPHKEEYYLSIICKRDENTISFSPCGGIEVEENWDKVRHLGIGVDTNIDDLDVSPLLVDVSHEHGPVLSTFIRACYRVFVELDIHLLEMNPFTLDESGQPFPLDMRCELDDCASFLHVEDWKVNGHDVEFPYPFGSKLHPEERLIHELDEKTGASLKLTILNPKGRIWAMVAGGGASVIYADTVADLGYGHELGNYGEYSGDPTQDDTFKYACTLLGLATKEADHAKPRALLVGGGIANFTDVAATFNGIIRALKVYAGALQEANMKIFVRRGGPSYQAGLKNMRDACRDLEVPVAVYGPEASMTGIVQEAIAWIEKAPSTCA